MNITAAHKLGFVLGTIPGLALTYYLFTHVTWYHNMVVQAWTNPWFLAAGVATGVVLAVLDKDNDVPF